MMTTSHLPPPAAHSPAPIGSTCPVCERPESLRVTRTETGRTYRCRYALDDDCSFEGIERPFRRATVEHMSAAFAERLARIADRVVDDCQGKGEATARVDTTMVTPLRSAIRRAARERGMAVRTVHVGDGRIKIRTA